MDMRKDAEGLVWAGITAVSGQIIDGTQDPNRSGKRRLDIAIYHTDGGYVRIHPGNKIRDDAKPRYFTADEAAGGAAEHAGTEWNTVSPTGVWNWDRAQRVPQVDELSMKRVWRIIKNDLPTLNNELDITDGSILQWWLWIGNLGSNSQAVIGDGITRARVSMDQDGRKATFTFHRTDGTDINVLLYTDKCENLHTRLC